MSSFINKELHLSKLDKPLILKNKQKTSDYGIIGPITAGHTPGLKSQDRA